MQHEVVDKKQTAHIYNLFLQFVLIKKVIQRWQMQIYKISTTIRTMFHLPTYLTLKCSAFYWIAWLFDGDIVKT